MPRLSETQTTLLTSAAARRNSSLLPLPENLKARGAALDRALAVLVKHGLAEEIRARSEAATWRRSEGGVRIGLVITAVGMASIGLIPAAAAGAGDQSSASSTVTAATLAAGPAARPGGKLGAIITAVDKKDGATIAELATSAGWQPHTTRAALTRLRQRGFDIRLEEMGERRAYRLHGAG